MKYYVESFLSYLYKKVIVSRAGHDTNTNYARVRGIYSAEYNKNEQK